MAECDGGKERERLDQLGGKGGKGTTFSKGEKGNRKDGSNWLEKQSGGRKTGVVVNRLKKGSVGGGGGGRETMCWSIALARERHFRQCVKLQDGKGKHLVKEGGEKGGVQRLYRIPKKVPRGGKYEGTCTLGMHEKRFKGPD